MADAAASASAAAASADEEKKTFLTEPNLKGEDLADDFPDYEDDMAPEEDNQDTAMLKKEHQMRIMDDALELMKREFAARMEEVARKEAKLALEKAALDGMVEKFRDFIQENDAKKEKAMRKAAEESEAIAKLTSEEASWERQIEEARRRRQALADQTQSLTAYFTFLASVASDPGSEFDDTADMLGRWARLSATYDAQAATVNRKKEAVAAVRTRLVEVAESAETSKLEMSSAMETNRRLLEELVERGRELADEQAAADDVGRRLVVEQSQVRMSVSNLLARCRDSVVLTADASRFHGADASASASASASAAAAAGGARARKTTIKALGNMQVAPPKDGSPAALKAHLAEALAVVERRMKDLVQLERRYPGWVAEQARAKKAAERRAAAAREEEERARRSKMQAAAGKRERVADMRQSRAKGHEDSLVSGSDALEGGMSVVSRTESEHATDLDEGDDAGGAVARHFAGNTYRVRLGGRAGPVAAAGAGPPSSTGGGFGGSASRAML